MAAVNTAKKKVAIIGAGLAGMSAGSFLARNGFEVEIFEMHDLPGGQCTSWKNGKFIFDGCVHWLVGSKPHAYMNRIWKELEALENIQIIDHDRYSTVHFADGSSLTFHADPDRLEAELLRFSPEDEKEIKNFVNAIRRAAKLKMLEPDMATGKKTFKDLLVLLRFLAGFSGLFKWVKISAREYGAKFKKPQLATAITNLFAPDFSMLFNLFTFAWLAQGNAGYPVGGSLNFSRNIEKNCQKHGVTFHYKSRVKKIIVEKNGQPPSGRKNASDRASAIELENGHIIGADYVISAADGRTTIEQLLGGNYHHPRLKKAWEILPLFEPLFYISLGIKGSWQPPAVSGNVLVLKTPLEAGNTKVTTLLMHSLAFDPTLAPAGKSVMEIFCPASFDYWNNLKNESREKYKAEKERLAQEIIEIIERDFFPGFQSKIEKMDIATPTTWVRYTGVYRGSFEGLQMTKDFLKVGTTLPMQLEGLDHFYLCGQWVTPGGGLPTAAYSGKAAAALVLQAEGRELLV